MFINRCKSKTIKVIPATERSSRFDPHKEFKPKVYRPEIDGLRAIAVVPVILFHFGENILPGGFLGVDVFFVISGYLITSIIQKELNDNSFSFVNFWKRRFTRIFPALLFVSACTLVASYFLAFRPYQQEIGAQSLAAFFSLSNVYFWRTTGDYWGVASEESPFLHTWSLALEEQFYLFFPVMVFLLHRGGRNLPILGIASLTAVSLLLFTITVHTYKAATFYLLPTRAWELGAGCLTAWLSAGYSSSTKRLEALAFLGLIVVLCSYNSVDHLGLSAIAVVLGSSFILAAGGSGVCYTLLSAAPLVHVGKISYSLYLWHWPFIALANHASIILGQPANLAASTAAIYVLSLFTYRFVETPGRHSRKSVKFICLALLVVASCANAMWFFPRQYDTSEFAEAVYIPHNCHPKIDNNSRVKARLGTTKLMNDGWEPDAYRTNGIRLGSIPGPPEIVLLGDSHGCMWSEAVACVADDLGIPATSFCADGVSPFLHLPLTKGSGSYNMSREDKYLFDDARLKRLQEWKPRLVIIGAFWESISLAESRDLLEFIGKSGSRVLLIGDPPTFPCGDKNAMQWLAHRQIFPIAGSPVFLDTEESSESVDELDLPSQIASHYPFVDVIPTSALFSSTQGVFAISDRNVIYLDDDHVLQAGAELIIPLLRKKIELLWVSDDSNATSLEFSARR